MNGMIGGQVLDMLAEHRRISETELRLLQKLKTGCLRARMRARLHAAAGKTDTKSIAAARAYGDKSRPCASRSRTISSTSRATRKRSASPSASDAASEKSTFPSLLGLDACRKLAGGADRTGGRGAHAL